MRTKFVNAAISYYGCNEADGSYKKIIDLYNSITPLPVGYKLKYTDEWCAGFVSAVAKACNLTSIVFPECGCERMISLYKKANRWQENDGYSPLPGDIIFYDWADSGSGDNQGFSDHVGIVVSNSYGDITVIEGNMSNKVAYRTIKVNARYIRGYGLPNFPEGTTATTPTKAPTSGSAASQAAKTVSVSLQVLSKGSKGGNVKAMQMLLIAKGYSCGSYGADGDFGAATEAALVKFQKASKLTVDGICGASTWNALLGV